MSKYAVSPCDIASVQAQLLATIIQRQPDTGHWLALIDSAFDHEGKSLRWSRTLWPVYGRGKLAPLQSVSPVLLDLSVDSGADLRQEILRLLLHCQARPMLAFLHSNIEPQTLINNWQSVLEIETEDAQSFLLRFADTRTTPVIAEVLAADAWPRLCHGLKQWLYVDRRGQLQSLPIAMLQLESTPQKSIRISGQALTDLLQRGQPDALANVLQENFPDVLTTTGVATYQRLTAICALAEKNGIDRFPDIVALAVALYSTGDDLREEGSLATWLKQRSWGQGQFVEALTAHVEALEGVGQ